MTKLQKIILTAMAVGMVGLLIAAGAVFATRQDPKLIVSEFVPPEFDPAAVSGTPEQPDESAAYGTLELKPDAIVSMCANITVENDAARIYFTSHEGNLGWMKIKLLDENGNLLGQSGLVNPGEYIRDVKLDAVPKESGLIVAKILIYEPDTYYSLGSASAQVMLTVQ